jgi:succinyl-CoA synthetase alpha subunit
MRSGQCPAQTRADVFRRLARMAISRDEGMLRLISEHLTIEDILEVRRRMIGTGLIGGKTVGMLLANASS